MPKTLRDCLLIGGVKGKTFIDKNYSRSPPIPKRVIYEILNIEVSGKPEETWGVVYGRIIKPKTDKLYSKLLDKCLNHEEVKRPK